MEYRRAPMGLCFSKMRLLRILLICPLLLGINLAFPQEAGQIADWEGRRVQAQALKERAAAIRTEADTAYKQEDRRCYDEVLTNRCLEAARRSKVNAYQSARQLDIDARRIELAVKHEEKAQREADARAKEPERTMQTRQRIQDAEDRHTAQRQHKESSVERKTREAERNTERLHKQAIERADRRREHEQRMQDKAEKARRKAERDAQKSRDAESEKQPKPDYL